MKLGLPGVVADESWEHHRIRGKRIFFEAMEFINFTISHQEDDKLNESKLDQKKTKTNSPSCE